MHAPFTPAAGRAQAPLDENADHDRVVRGFAIPAQDEITTEVTESGDLVIERSRRARR